MRARARQVGTVAWKVVPAANRDRWYVMLARWIFECAGCGATFDCGAEIVRNTALEHAYCLPCFNRLHPEIAVHEAQRRGPQRPKVKHLRAPVPRLVKR